eukprot:12303538-Alexandrium_andersonii.AAC.1
MPPQAEELTHGPAGLLGHHRRVIRSDLEAIDRLQDLLLRGGHGYKSTRGSTQRNEQSWDPELGCSLAGLRAVSMPVVNYARTSGVSAL